MSVPVSSWNIYIYIYITYSWSVVRSTSRAINQLITIRRRRISKKGGYVSAAILDVCEWGRRRVRLLPSKIRLFHGCVLVAVKSALQVRSLVEDKVEEIVVEFIIQVCEHLWKRLVKMGAQR